MGNVGREGGRERFIQSSESGCLKTQKPGLEAGCQGNFTYFGYEVVLQVIVVRRGLWISVFLLVHMRNQACRLDDIDISRHKLFCLTVKMISLMEA